MASQPLSVSRLVPQVVYKNPCDSNAVDRAEIADDPVDAACRTAQPQQCCQPARSGHCQQVFVAELNQRVCSETPALSHQQWIDIHLDQTLCAVL